MDTPLLDTPRGVGGKIDRNTGKLLTTPPASTTLTSASLTPTPYFNITPPKPSTAAEGFQGYMGATATQVAQEKARADASQSDVFTSMLKSDTTNGLTDKLYADSVDPAKVELTDINNKLVASQHAQQRELEALGSQGALTPAQKNAQTDAINRKYISEQADLSIMQMAKQGKYSDAKEIADRAVTALMEKQKNQNAALMFNYEENIKLFNKDEQHLFEASQAERNRTLENEEYRLRAQFDQKIKQSDPQYQAQLAATYALANQRNGTGAGGTANVKLTPTQQKSVSDIDGVTNSIDQINQLGNQIGWSGIGGFGQGSMKQFLAKNLGQGSTEEEQLRNYIGNLKGTIALARGGTSFTSNEQALLESYTPTINDSPLVIQSKLSSLQNLFNGKRESILTLAGGNSAAPTNTPTSAANDLRAKYNY